jgi:prephenate dehydrogenase
MWCIWTRKITIIHAAYVSHISHITSFALANTVLEKEKEKKPFLNYRAAVLKVRYALQKRSVYVGSCFYAESGNVLDVLNEHITQ